MVTLVLTPYRRLFLVIIYTQLGIPSGMLLSGSKILIYTLSVTLLCIPLCIITRIKKVTTIHVTRYVLLIKLRKSQKIQPLPLPPVTTISMFQLRQDITKVATPRM